MLSRYFGRGGTSQFTFDSTRLHRQAPLFELLPEDEVDWAFTRELTLLDREEHLLELSDNLLCVAAGYLFALFLFV